MMLQKSRFVTTLVVSWAFCIAGCATTESVPAFDTDEYLSAWVNLWNTYDLSMVDDLFLTDSNVTYFSSEREGLIKGISAVRTHHEGFGFVPGGKVVEQELWVNDVHTATHGPTAIVTGVWFFGQRDNAPDNVQRGPFTFVYVIKGPEYRLAHLNFGTYLDTQTEEGE
ncbi:hypothetical protein ACFL3B_04380 [Gemmatimonadota bacterium]